MSYLVKYEKYQNDYKRKYETKTFNTLNGVEDWLFSLVHGKLKDKMFFVNPDSKTIYSDGDLKLDSSCISSMDNEWRYWIHQIEKDGKIIYSCGTYTNRKCFWNEEIKDWLRKCRKRLNNPQFDFADDDVKKKWEKEFKGEVDEIENSLLFLDETGIAISNFADLLATAGCPINDVNGKKVKLTVNIQEV